MDELVLDVVADSRWVPVLVGPGDDVDDWAIEIATEALRIRGFAPPPSARLAEAAAVLAGIARNVHLSAQDAPIVGAWSLMPGPEVLPETLATLRPLVPDDGVASRSAMVDALVAGPEDRYGDPQLEELDTPTGVATRMVQRLLTPGQGDGQQDVEEAVAYIWWLADAEMALVLSTYFLDLVEGGRWRPECDDLARSIKATVA